MKAKVGLWIDHRKAIVVAVTDREEEIGLIISAIEKQARRLLGSRHTGPYEPQQVPADDSRQRSLTGHLNRELKKRLGKIGLGGRIARVETVDKMTDRQIAAKVRRHFAK